MSEQPAAGWYPDPYGRHEHRWWDGSVWTEHVATAGRQQVDPVPAAAAVPTVAIDPSKIQRQVQEKAGVQVGAVQGGGTLLTEPILVVNQKVKLIELNNEYAVFDQHGRQIGAVRQVGQTAARKALRLLTSVDQFLTHRLQVCDMAGNVVLAVTRPAKVVKSTVVVADGSGVELGRLVQENAIGKIRFRMEAAGGQPVGMLAAENWRAWDFSISDGSGAEVARVTKTWEGLGKTLFTNADNYVLRIHRPLEEPLRSLVVASALTVDTALKQDSRGLG